MSKKEPTASYRKPPKKHQFQKGQSGNPKGRPKGARNVRTLASAEMSKRIRIREGDKTRSVTKGEALFIAASNKAIKGDTRAADFMTSLVIKAEEQKEENRAEAALSEDDTKLFEQFIEYIRCAPNDSKEPA